jgi:hypothetical protein
MVFFFLSESKMCLEREDEEIEETTDLLSSDSESYSKISLYRALICCSLKRGLLYPSLSSSYFSLA